MCIKYWLPILLIAGLLISACSSTATPKPVATTQTQAVQKTIKVAWLTDMTGPTASSSTPMVWGTEDWFKKVNAEGSLKGVKVETIWGDSSYKLDRGLEIYAKWAADPDVICINCSLTHINNAIAGKCVQDQKVLYAASPAPDAMYPIKWTYSHSAGYGDQLGAFVDWAILKSGKDKPLKLGLLYMDAAFGKAIYDAGGVSYCKARGVQIVSEEAIAAGTTDVTTQLIKTKAASPDYVYYQGTVDQAAIVFRDAKKTAFTTPICVSANSSPIQLVQLAGKESSEGAMFMTWSNPWAGAVDSEMTPGLKKVADFFASNRPKESPASAGVGYFHGLAGAMVTGEAIRLALEKVNPLELNGKTLKEQGFDRIKDFTGTWETTGAITYTPSDHRGGQKIKILQVKNGLSYTLADWFNTPYIVKDQLLASEYIKPGLWSDILK